MNGFWKEIPEDHYWLLDELGYEETLCDGSYNDGVFVSYDFDPELKNKQEITTVV